MKDYHDTTLSPKERAEALLKELSLEEKVRQIGCTNVMPGDLNGMDLRGGTGAVVVAMQSRARLLDDVVAIQNYVMEHSPHHIPALFHAEGLTGPVCLFGANQYPAPIGLGATFEPELVKQMASFTSRQLAANGVRHVLSPVSDLARDLRWGRCNETYGGDPTLSAAMTVAFVEGMQGNLKEGVAATCKHFLGYSVSEGALNAHQTLASRQILREAFAKPFEAAISLADLKCVMNSYSVIDGRPVTANKEILTDLLRGELHFDGTVVSDYGSLAQIRAVYNLSEDHAGAARLALEAGMDVELPERIVYGEELIEAVKRGEIEERLVDRACLRFLTLKFELGLFENPYGVGDYAAAMDCRDADEGSLEAALKSMTLLKNDGILPVEDRTKRIAVIGPSGNSLRMMYAHYMATATREMIASIIRAQTEKKEVDVVNIHNQGREENGQTASAPQPESIVDKYFFDGEIKRAYPEAKTIFEALAESFENITFLEGCDYKGKDRSGIQKAAALAKECDVVILTVGEKSGIDASCTSGEGVDTVSLSLPGVQDELVRAVYAANQNVVLVHTGCRPYCDEWAYQHLPAILEAWFPTTYGGEAVARVLTGEYSPAGRTPVDLPRSAAHTPVYFSQLRGSSSDDHVGMDGTGYLASPSTSLRPFGYGLSYTQFVYENAALHADEKGNIEISVTVKNVGARDGEEVVQLYGKDMAASMVRPRMELVGFRRVPLKRGEKKRVIFTLNIDALSFVTASGKWAAEAGAFEFYLGPNSGEKRAVLPYTLKETKYVDPNRRTFFAESSYSEAEK